MVKDAVLVSHEMVTLVGPGGVPEVALPDDPVVFAFASIGAGRHSVLSYRDGADFDGLANNPLVFVVARTACRRLFAVSPVASSTWHLPTALRALALTIVDCEAIGEALSTLRLARSIELLCQIHGALAKGSLVSTSGEGSLTERDIARITSARLVVDQCWQEKLTIADLARTAGVNRDKLVRGFRELYGATVAEVLSERRLAEARRLLLASDLPVATVGYRCSYQNNAAFTRAFARRYGVVPTQFRRAGVAA